jgi:hypothetical protein
MQCAAKMLLRRSHSVYAAPNFQPKSGCTATPRIHASIDRFPLRPQTRQRLRTTIPGHHSQGHRTTAFSCNCVHNFVYGDLQGRRTGTLQGPMTFGEIAY